MVFTHAQNSLHSGDVKIAIEHGPFIADLPIKDGDDPVRYVNVYQRLIIYGYFIDFP